MPTMRTTPPASHLRAMKGGPPVIGVTRGGRVVRAQMGAEDEAPRTPGEVHKAEEVRRFSEAEVAERAAKESDKGKRSGRREVLEALGLGDDVSLADVRSMLEQKRQEDEARLSDAEKAKRDADQARAEATAERAQAQQERAQIAQERALLRAGVSSDLLDDARLLLRVDATADESAMAEAVSALKARHAALFTAPSVSAPGTITPGTPPRPAGPTGDAFTRGAERAKALRGS